MKSCYTIVLSETKIAILDNCDYYGKGRIITRINVPAKFRGKGYGSKLLSLCTKDADEEDARLWLEIAPSGGLSYSDLEAWYARNSFVNFRGTGVYVRNPKRSPGESRD